MPHEMGYCDCGREIHFPCTARYGDRWRCYNCGRIWDLVPNRIGAKPGYLVESRRPKPKPTPQVVVVVREAPRPAQRQRALPAPAPRQLPAPPRRDGLLAWLFGE
jgi:hypothetical protein